jgi:CheY-like chemotaxis protein
MPTIWLFDDNPRRGVHLMELMEESSEFVVEFRTTIPDAIATLNKINDTDWVSLDSQMPDSKGSIDVNAGIRLAAEIRIRGKKCHLIWHSLADDCQHLFGPLGIEARPYESLPWLRISQATVPGDVEETAACILKALRSDPFEMFAPLVILLQGYLFSSEFDGAAGANPVREDLRMHRLWSDASELTRENKDVAFWRMTNWNNWFRPAIDSLRNDEAILDRQFLRWRFYLIHKNRNLNWFFENPVRRRMFEVLGLTAENPHGLHDACVEVISDMLANLLHGCGHPRLSESAVVYAALEVLGLYHGAGADALAKAAKKCAHDCVNGVGAALCAKTRWGGTACIEDAVSLLQGKMTPDQAPKTWENLQSWTRCRKDLERISEMANSIEPVIAGYTFLDGFLSAGTKAWLFPLSRLCVDSWLRSVRDWEHRVSYAGHELDQAMECVRQGGSGAELSNLNESLLGVLRAF